jgi:hypothetical protein
MKTTLAHLLPLTGKPGVTEGATNDFDFSQDVQSNQTI